MDMEINKTVLVYNPSDNTVVDYSGCKYKTNFIYNSSMNFKEVNKLLKSFLFERFDITDNDIFYPTKMMSKMRDFKINQILSQ